MASGIRATVSHAFVVGATISTAVDRSGVGASVGGSFATAGAAIGSAVVRAYTGSAVSGALGLVSHRVHRGVAHRSS
jgi:hypothetical protein